MDKIAKKKVSKGKCAVVYVLQSSPVLDYSPTSQVIVIRYLDIKQK